MKKISLILFILLVYQHIKSQDTISKQSIVDTITLKKPKPKKDHTYKPLTLKLNEDGSKFVRIITWHQFWGSYTENNPGTLDVNGKAQKGNFDFAIRRSRLLILAQVSPKFLILTHFGINNQSFINGGFLGTSGANNSGKKPQMYIHDAWVEYAPILGKLHIGAGLHYWNGVTRMASASTLNFMTMDAPIHNWFNIEGTDQFARQLGLYVKGQIGKFDYRLNVNKPYVFGVANNSSFTSPYAVNIFNEKWSTAGYFDFQIFDKEDNKLPYFVGTYLGAKKVLNVGVGYHFHPKSTAYRPSPTDSVKVTNQMNFGADVYLDMPLKTKKPTAINFYSSFTYHNFGPNYLRNLGILNEHTTTESLATNPNTSWSGGGNLQPTIGTGFIWYSQLGFLTPKLKNGSAFMPYVSHTLKDFDRIGKVSNQVDVGLNYLINGHNAKITVQYGIRPVYKSETGNPNPVQNGYKGQLTFQTHIFL